MCTFSLFAQEKIATAFFDMSRPYAQAMQQPQIDSTLKLTHHRNAIQGHKIVGYPDTLIAHNFYWVEKKENLSSILSMGDTASTIVELTKPFGYTPPFLCPYEVVEEHYELTPETTAFIFTGKDKLNPKNWRYHSKFHYRKRKRMVLKYPCDYRLIDFPGEDTTLVAFYPNKKLTNQEQGIIRSLCTKTFMYTRYEPVKFTKFTHSKSIATYEYEVRQKGGYQLVQIYSEEKLHQNLISIKTKLKSEGYYEGTLDMNIDQPFKLAVMNYQIDDGFPIGQFDVKTIEAILSE